MDAAKGARPEGQILIPRFKRKPKAKTPEDSAVILLNDDFTPWGFVKAVLMEVFHKTGEEAEVITASVHEQGRGVAGVYPRDIALTKTAQVDALAAEAGFPLKCVVE